MRSRYRSVWPLLAVSAALFVAAPEPAQAKDEAKDSKSAEDDIDYVALSARMIKDGHFDRARLLLDQVDVKKPGLDLPRFHTLRGLALLEQKNYSAAERSLKSAIAAGQKEAIVYVYLAQAHFGLKDYQNAISAVQKAGDAGRDTPGLFLLRSQAHWELKEYAAAIRALDEGAAAFPQQPDFARTKLFYLIDLGLFQEVAQLGDRYLSRADATAEDYAAVGEGLRRSRQFRKARDVLESARLRFPSDEKLLVLLAHTYLDDEHPLIAAMIFEEAARLYPQYALEAAELYSRAGRHERALTLNAAVGDQKAKMKQRLSILLKLERSEAIASMAPRLSRLGLLEDDQIRYALAYGLFKSGDFEQAERQLKHITDGTLFENALQLRRAMQACKEAGWEC